MNKIYLAMIISACFALYFIATGAPIVFCAFFVAIPIAIYMVLPKPGVPYPVKDYDELLGRSITGDKEVNGFIQKARNQIQSFQRLKIALEEICLVNLQDISYSEFKEMIRVAEEVFSTSTGKIYSRIQVVRATQRIKPEDYEVILYHLKVNDEAIEVVADFLNEVTNTNNHSLSLDRIRDYTESLRRLNGR